MFVLYFLKVIIAIIAIPLLPFWYFVETLNKWSNVLNYFIVEKKNAKIREKYHNGN